MPRVLVIDDDDQLRRLLRLMLEREGYEVWDAPNGKEGLKRVHEAPMDLVITDLIMPEKEGIETIRELLREFPNMKIIAMSGGGQVGPETYLQIAEKFGAHRTLVKPFDKNELITAVKEVLGEVIG
jgi:CheY-like chemotaxis protein